MHMTEKQKKINVQSMAMAHHSIHNGHQNAINICLRLHSQVGMCCGVEINQPSYSIYLLII